MTVIVYRDGVMAADTAGWCGDVRINTDEVKIHRTATGLLIGCAGSLPEIEAFRKWADGGFHPADKPEPAESFGSLCVSPDGTIIKYAPNFRSYTWKGDWAVEGAHEEFLCGALAAGATAVQTVELAIKHMAYAAGQITVLRL